jgi:hypothetical protein
MEKQKSVVEFLKEKLEDGHLDISNIYLNKLLTEAEKIFEQQIMDSFEIGDLVGRAAAARVFEPDDKVVIIYPEITSEEYYNKTFKSE